MASARLAYGAALSRAYRRLGERLSRALGPAGQYRPLPNRQVSRPYMYARSCWAWTSGHAAVEVCDAASTSVSKVLPVLPFRLA
jgi:hypothetical protein